MTDSNMTCEAFDAALPDYLEGTLAEPHRTAVSKHLSECVRCTGLVRDLEKIQREAAALPDLVPSRDLWQGIEARIAAPVLPLSARPERQRRLTPKWMGIAAAALVMSTAGITYMLTARSLQPGSSGSVAALTKPIVVMDSQQRMETGVASSPETTSSPAIDAASLTPTRSGVAAVRQEGTNGPREGSAARLVNAPISPEQRSEGVYGKEIEMLQNIVSQRKTQLDSATIAIIERNLQIIDAAIASSRAALVKDPASRLLSDQLTHALDKKVELLRTAALLPAST